MDLPTRYPVIGTRVAAHSLEDAVSLFLRAPAAGCRLSAHFCTAHSVVEAARDPRLQALLNADDAISSPDGVPLVWVGRMTGRRVGRVAGPDLMPALLDRSREIGGRHFFYGGAEGVPEQLAETFTRRFPGLQVVGTWSPPFRPLSAEEDAAEVEMINAARPDYVWVGLGSPKQDLWVGTHRPRLDAPVILAVGAAFDFHTGRIARAPRWMQRIGLEWLFRLASEPRRLLERYTVVNGRFLYLVGRQIARRRLRRRAAS